MALKLAGWFYLGWDKLRDRFTYRLRDEIEESLVPKSVSFLLRIIFDFAILLLAANMLLKIMSVIDKLANSTVGLQIILNKSVEMRTAV